MYVINATCFRNIDFPLPLAPVKIHAKLPSVESSVSFGMKLLTPTFSPMTSSIRSVQ